jgi:hypothetical protein
LVAGYFKELHPHPPLKSEEKHEQPVASWDSNIISRTQVQSITATWPGSLVDGKEGKGESERQRTKQRDKNCSGRQITILQPWKKQVCKAWTLICLQPTFESCRLWLTGHMLYGLDIHSEGWMKQNVITLLPRCSRVRTSRGLPRIKLNR